ncbi:hypothetical protein [Mesorhizobium sp. M0618]|uniref:hypothetical protein n=1 Tax=unclassified Mesorhizobium TaxID=325217 RepID=UPI003338E7CA
MAGTFDRIKLYRWHGNVYRARGEIGDLHLDAEAADTVYLRASVAPLEPNLTFSPFVLFRMPSI